MVKEKYNYQESDFEGDDFVDKTVMKTFKYLFCTLLFITAFTACSEEDGDWESMEWQKVYSEKAKVNGTTCYIIPVEGGSCQFVCKNYSSFWIGYVRVFADYSDWNGRSGDFFYPESEDGNNRDFQTVNAGGVTVSVENNVLRVVFDENTSVAKCVTVCVTAGDIFYTFHFMQGSLLLTSYFSPFLGSYNEDGRRSQNVGLWYGYVL